jgi:glycosyltransferase involved in cell wall biosynthesis
MNILFVNYGGFESNSAVHIFHLANQLVERGLDCAVAVPEKPERVSFLGAARFRSLAYDAAEALKFGFANGEGPSLIHAWTPREGVRRLVQPISQACGCRYVVHLEDNEEEITANQIGVPVKRLRALGPARLDGMIPPGLSHPIHYREFLKEAAGATVIMDRLLEFLPQGSLSEVAWPGFDPIFASLPERNPELRYGLSIAEDEFVVVYTGNTHASNLEEMRSLYTGIGLLGSRGYKIRLIRFGTDYRDPLDSIREMVRPYCIEMGFRSRETLPGHMAMADALVQPGKPGGFNDYRFPSKVPDFLVSGRPVVLPRTNIGRFLRDREECLHLDEGNAIDIANKLELLIREPGLRKQIGKGGREFAQRELGWKATAAKFCGLYHRVLSLPPRSSGRAACRDLSVRRIRNPRWPRMDARTLEAAASRYAGCFPVDALSYGTVRDFCDSYDHLHALATEAHDLKDCQRPWVFKAILGTVPYGARLLEIGAGEPIIAELLSCLGYDVWVVDPYEGQGNGPVQYEHFCKQYPDIHILRRQFTEDIDAFDAETFDCIYSNSVLEHIPASELRGIFGAVNRLLKPEGRSIHAVDHVLRGKGAEWHKANAGCLLELCGFAGGTLDTLEHRMAQDPDTFYLSAEGHNRWRGTKPYDEFPMRQVVSLQINTGRPTGSNHAKPRIPDPGPSVVR